MTHTQLAKSALQIANKASDLTAKFKMPNWDECEGWMQEYYVDIAARVNSRLGYTPPEIHESIAAELATAGFLYGPNYKNEVLFNTADRQHPFAGEYENLHDPIRHFHELFFVVATELAEV